MDLLGSVTGLATTLLDAPPVLGGKTVTHFYIGIREVDAISNGQIVELGSASTPVQVDLLQYQNGASDWMTQTDVPQQSYSQLRYVVDLSSTQAVFSDGTTQPVQVSSSATKSSSGFGAGTSTAPDQTYANTIDVTVNAPFTLSSDNPAIQSDFNLGESLSEDDGTVIMRPTLSVAMGSGQISGTVVNYWGQAVKGAMIVAVNSSGAAVDSATTGGNGAFDIDTLPAGTYQLEVYNAYTNAAGYALSASGQTRSTQEFDGPYVTVTAGNTASAGTIGD